MDQVGGNLRLQLVSPCIKRRQQCVCSAGPDLDGNPRIVGGKVDIGAYEFQGTNTPPSITTQPTNQTVNVGDTANISVTGQRHVSIKLPLEIQGDELSGATNMLLTLTNVQLTQAGSYAVLVTIVMAPSSVPMRC